MYKAYITTLTNVRKHPNADRLLLADVFGNTVCVSTDYCEGEVGVYFPCDGQLSVEFAEQNNLLRKKDDAGNNIGGYMDPDKRNVTAIRLRGEKSDGLFLPLSCLTYTGVDMDTLNVGDVIDGAVNGHDICQKYIPRRRDYSKGYFRSENIRKKKIASMAPLFAEHADTEQLPYNLSAFKIGDEIEITLKMHGTSQRTGYLPVFKGYKRTFFDWLFRREGKPVYDWGYVSGTRRVVLENYDGGFYGSNEFREQHSKMFEGKLNKGETVYYEVVGFTTNGTPIMSSANNAKLQDKEFIKQYGKETVFSYGCEPNPAPTTMEFDNFGAGHLTWEKPQSDIYVYRMTLTNEDGFVVEYTPDFMRYRCEQMGVKCVPAFGKAIISEDRLHFVAPDGYDHDYRIGDGTIGNMILKLAEEYYDGPDPIGKTHVREGVVVRITNRPKFSAYKYKNFSFKCLEGLVKVEAIEPDIEEAQEVTDNE